MRGENNAEQPERTYAYYRCGGKYEDDGEGGKHRVCSGHVFTLETKMSYCPACGEPLKTLISKQEAPEAITCALEKCLSCKSRERSVAVNDERCLGGTGYKDGKERKVLGACSTLPQRGGGMER